MKFGTLSSFVNVNKQENKRPIHNNSIMHNTAKKQKIKLMGAKFQNFIVGWNENITK